MTEKTNHSPKRARGDSAQRIYNVLREDILSMTLLPAQPLDEVSVAERFGVSRSPVREALVRLAAHGLVQTLPNKSTIVAPLNVEAFPQFMDALDLLQRAVTRLAAVLRTDEDLQHLINTQQSYESMVSEGNVVGMIEQNREFHMAVAQATHNHYLATAYANLLDEGRRFLRLYYRSYQDALPTSTQHNHLPIIDAIRQKDADRAEQIAHEHAMELQTRFLHYMNTRYTQNISVSMPAKAN